VDRTQLCFWERHGRYSDSIADLQRNAAEVEGALDPAGASIMTLLVEHHLDLALDAGADGKSYIQRVTGRGVDTYIERRGTRFTDYDALGWRHLPERCTP
jgi:hypothetical protein